MPCSVRATMSERAAQQLRRIDRLSWRWWRFFLAAVLVSLFGAGTASAATPAFAEARVGASTVATAYVVGPHKCIRAGERRGSTPPEAGSVVGFCVAANAVDDVASASNKIYSSRALQRMADEPGPFHNFPGSFDETVFSQGTGRSFRTTSIRRSRTSGTARSRTGCPAA